MTDQNHRAGNRQAPPWERETDADAASFGPWLRQQRELREITLREISDATKISLRYLQALEEERFDLLPASVFARGFLRQYARYVGLDPDEAVNRLLVSQKGDETELDEDEEEPEGASRRGTGSMLEGTPAEEFPWRTALLVLLLALVLLALVFLVPRLAQRDAAPEPAPEPPVGVAVPDVPADVPEPPPAPEVEPSAAPLTVTLDFRRDCWVEASVDGEPRVAEMRIQGESLQLQAEESVELRLGDAGAVAVEVNGEPYAVDGQPGQVRTVRIEAPEEPEPQAAGPVSDANPETDSVPGPSQED
ncbi:MAG: helix-turn-helix domain-containing protein [Thermoanaerobaculia bacterium]